MIKTFWNKKLVGSSLTLSLFMLVASCNPTEINSKGTRGAITVNDASLANSAYIYRDSPAIMQGLNTQPWVDIKKSMDLTRPEFITASSQLTSDCTFMEDALFGSGVETGCMQVYSAKSATQTMPTKNSDGSWVYPPGSSEFYQVNNMYHLNAGVNKFFENLRKAYSFLYRDLSTATPRSIPYYLVDSKLYWFKAMSPANDSYFRNNFMSSYALCNLEMNARFSPAGPELCFGKWSEQPLFFIVQDPSVIYHELGHALIAIMMNFRNGTSSTSYHALRSNLGAYGYDEAGSIGEGFADYFSYVMNERPHIGEWALTKVTPQSRPMTEDDPMHISGISATPEGRLSYPEFLLYDPNDPKIPIEDVHYAGQIVSHYLVALTESFKDKCSLDTSTAHEDATSYVMLLMAETLSELGDLRARGYDNNLTPYGDSVTHRFANLDEDSSFVWAHTINPPTYRRFFQTFAKNINKYISSWNGLCPSFDKNSSEKLLDDYGLLLFRTYNDNMNSTKNKNVFVRANGTIGTSTTPPAPTLVQPTNRRKSVLVSKELLKLAEVGVEENIVTYYIIDDRKNMQDLLENLLFKGFPVNLSKGIAGVEYNNSNIKISPGEVVAVIPNLYNSSNSTMAGVQLLATDWDHVHITDTSGNTGNYKPCVVDSVTTVDQGAVASGSGTCATTLSTYRRNIKQSSTGSYCRDDITGTHCNEAVAPVCMVEVKESGSAKWVSQNEFRTSLALQNKDCLGFGYTGTETDFTFNPHECLMRALPGATSAFYSKIDPQKSYVSTIRNGNPDHSFSPSNSIVFEVNKWVPPGTKFRCRLRARFSNCSDCFHDPSDSTLDDYIDAELNGHKPFKIINIEFEVND